MKNLFKVFAVACVLFSSDLFAQQDPMYSQYMFNMLPINPAYAGSREMLSVTAMYRKQWVGIEGAPTTFTFSADTPIRNQRMALGLNLVSDQIGIAKTLTINACYAYRIQFTNGGLLSLGLQAGLNQYRADYSSVVTSQNFGGPMDNAFAGSVSSMFPNFGFGAYYYTDKFYVGVASPKMIKNNLNGENNPTIDFTSYPNRQNRHLFITSGYTFELNQDWDLKPSTLIKGVHGAPLEFDINVNAWWKKKVGGGLSYRTADAILAMVQFQVKPELQFGYAYDMTVSGLSGTNSGSHEVMLRYEPHAKKHANKARFNGGKKKAFNSRGKNSFRKKSNFKRKKSFSKRSRKPRRR
ncbi:PorP/SprF family type IX secretion system membrane protein [Pseudochryseolinea flava]|uniref:Type IX secretion system membrane protein PorP/SprF n=1 Tax=Pseudochryseolinea flava TaxID=2059302 RepID=A0A364Y609_9BACT|nr:type IX secretion system membrane protein PorP/SprF [Pseudochryseolinea flava]RAW02393.1 hypothetical protein DQQ10_07630 [Pseudochryseolinea flava]